MYSEKLEKLIKGALADGKLEEREINVLRKKAEEEGLDPDEVQMEVEARLAEMKAEAELTARETKYEKVGNVRKCPQCGAVLTGMEAVCPECGHVFTGIEAAKTVKEFTTRLEGIKDFDERCDFIKTFPVPNTAEDLREMALLLATSLIPGTQDNDTQLRASYVAKLKECVTKIKISFENDPRFNIVLEEAKNAVAISEEKDKRDKKSDRKGLIGFVLFMAALIALAVFFDDRGEIEEIPSLIIEAQKNISEGNKEKAIELLQEAATRNNKINVTWPDTDHKQEQKDKTREKIESLMDEIMQSN